MDIGQEFRRCLVELDVQGILALHRQIAPFAKAMPPDEALISIHMARCEVENFPFKVRDYSFRWLLERGYVYEGGRWRHTLAKEAQKHLEVVGISSTSAPGGPQLPFNHLVMRGMRDALLNGMANGITEPQWQKELMLKERDRLRFKARKA